MPKLIRITTAPLSMKYLLTGQMRYMKEQGFEVIMVSSEGREWPDIISNEGCEHVIIHMTRKITPMTDLVSLWNLYRFIRKQKPDIVHSHTPKAGLLAMVAAKLAGVKFRIHTIAGLRFVTSSGLTRNLLVKMEKLTASAATHVWPNSFSLLSYIRDHGLASQKKLEVIGLGSSNGINLIRFSPKALQPDKLRKIKEQVNFDNNLIYLLCVGRIVRDKGIDELTKAFQRAYENNDRLRLVLVGTFEDEVDPVSNEVRQLLHSHPGIILTGWSDDVEYFMHFSFALLHPSYREGFPNVLLQAGAMFCPVLCSRIDGNTDIVEHRKTGLLFSPGNEAALYEQLDFALTNPDLMKQWASNQRSKIEQYFDQPVVHDQIRRRYCELLEKVPKG